MSLLVATIPASAADPDVLAGRYGHDVSEPAYQPVWEVIHEGGRWQARNVGDDDYSVAYRMSGVGRRAFWEKMGWPLASADTADCVSWGDAPASLVDMLEEAIPVTGADTYGLALVCHVPPATRAQIDWLRASAEDWFYYDPMAGVMEVRRLPRDAPTAP
ncbi:MAG: hypothetical protein EOP92_17600 [Lysobacteraceae bacterium]|nr:MAG: hypothetical protein EOP92_17600 [Xanthomonadaceae bacterium]